MLTLEYVPGLHLKLMFILVQDDKFCSTLPSQLIDFMLAVNDLVLRLPWTGIKINRLDMIDSRGYNRSRISSRAIEAYLIQVRTFFRVEPTKMIYLLLISSTMTWLVLEAVCKFLNDSV